MRGASVASKVAGVLIVAGVLLARPAMAAPIAAHVEGCAGDSCTAAPDGGPVSIDPDGFTLDVFWGPDFITLTEDPPGGHWIMQLLFEFTAGTHSGLEHMGAITLLDAVGASIGALNVQFDDLNPLERANYEIFGPLDQPFDVYGFQLALSDSPGVEAMNWVNVRFLPATATNVPEPEVWALIAVAAVAIVARQVWRLRRPAARIEIHQTRTR